jgi:hypothetical protein
MERIAWHEILGLLVASNWPELEAFAPASMRGLRHKVRHKLSAALAQALIAMMGDSFEVSSEKALSGVKRLDATFSPRILPTAGQILCRDGI